MILAFWLGVRLQALIFLFHAARPHRLLRAPCRPKRLQARHTTPETSSLQRVGPVMSHLRSVVHLGVPLGFSGVPYCPVVSRLATVMSRGVPGCRVVSRGGVPWCPVEPCGIPIGFRSVPWCTTVSRGVLFRLDFRGATWGDTTGHRRTPRDNNMGHHGTLRDSTGQHDEKPWETKGHYENRPRHHRTSRRTA